MICHYEGQKGNDKKKKNLLCYIIFLPVLAGTVIIL